MEHIKSVVHPARPWFNFSSSQAMDLNSIVFFAQAKDLAGCRLPEELEAKILQQTNRVHNVVNLVAGSYYWIGLASNIDYKIETRSPTGTQSPIESIVTQTSSGKTLMLSRFPEGSYILQLFLNTEIIRTISIFVSPKRKVVPSSDSTMGATKVVILVPQNKPWIVRRINLFVMNQDYFLVAAHNGNYVYHSQQKESRSIAVIEYGDASVALNQVKYASDVLLLWEESIPYTTVRLVSDVASGYGTPFMNFQMKSKANSGTSVNLDKLSSTLRSVITRLNDIGTIERTNIGAAIVSEPSSNAYEAFDSLIHHWTANPSNPCSRNVYLCLTYANDSLATAAAMAQQFTEEILPEASTIFGSRPTDSGLQIFVSCSVYCMWVLNLSIDAVAVQYPSLISITEIFMSDVESLDVEQPGFQELIAVMSEDGVSNAPDGGFTWRNARHL